MANISVMGGIQTEGGLKEAAAVQRRHNAEVADALLNISGIGTADGQPAHKDEPRPPQAHGQYPKMLYRPLPDEKGQLVVLHAEEEHAAIAKGWREEPYPKVQIEVLDPAREKAALKAKLDESESQLIQQNSVMLQMKETMEAMQAQLAELATSKRK